MEDLVIADRPSTRARRVREVEAEQILVTGADGYIGSVLTPMLSKSGYGVEGYDTGYYRSGWLYHDGHDRPRTYTRDIRHITVNDLVGYDAVVHLAELSNDPVCQFDEKTTYEINHKASVALAEKAKQAGVSRFVYASSCSVYGVATGNEATEESPVNPQTAYAHCKVLVERDVSALADRNFYPTFLRNATAFGPSPRMRFDIVLNNLAGMAWTTRCIEMTSDGMPWRPLVHVADICGAIIAALRAPKHAVANQVFNVGSDDQNYRVREIVGTVSDVFPVDYVTVGQKSSDNRSYRVSFDKIRQHLPEFRCKYDSRSGAQQLLELFSLIDLSEDTFTSPPFIRLRQLSRLVETKQLDSQFYWQRHALS